MPALKLHLAVTAPCFFPTASELSLLRVVLDLESPVPQPLRLSHHRVDTVQLVCTVSAVISRRFLFFFLLTEPSSFLPWMPVFSDFRDFRRAYDSEQTFCWGGA